MYWECKEREREIERLGDLFLVKKEDCIIYIRRFFFL